VTLSVLFILKSPALGTFQVFYGHFLKEKVNKRAERPTLLPLEYFLGSVVLFTGKMALYFPDLEPSQPSPQEIPEALPF
jgi:hypothetical protein